MSGSGRRTGRRACFGALVAVAVAVVIATLVDASSPARAAVPVFPDVDPIEKPFFPRDFGAHPTYRTEWWYVTGWLTTPEGDELGFQVTFFRTRLPVDEANPSRFAPRQMLFAHAAIVDPKLGRPTIEQRIARAGFGVTRFSATDLDVKLEDWTLVRVDDGPGQPGAQNPPLRFRAKAGGDRFVLDLDLRTSDAIVMQGADPLRPGYSQKGPSTRDASRYYSVPQLRVEGSLVRPGAAGPAAAPVAVKGTAWLDHEWSSAYLSQFATGWDWVGLNLEDGGALMVFQIRDRRGGRLWAGGARRFPDGAVERYSPDDLRFTTTRTWESKDGSGTLWPVGQSIEIVRRNPATANGAKVTPLSFSVDPLIDNQEVDARATSGTIYWEGAVRAISNATGNALLGRGYLELTGYWRPLKL